jgi:hypothetical protein
MTFSIGFATHAARQSIAAASALHWIAVELDCALFAFIVRER